MIEFPFISKLLGLINVEINVSKLWDGLKTATKYLNEKIVEPYHKDLLKKHFVFKDCLKLKPGSEHPEYIKTKRVHPDNIEAAAGIIELFDKLHCEYVSDLISDHEEGHYYSFGATTSTQDALIMLGELKNGQIYNPLGQMPFKTKYIFSSKNAKFGTSLRFCGGEIIERNVAAICDKKTGKVVFTPQNNSKGWLRNDYLLITKLPNIFGDEKIFDKDFKFLSFAGITGVGTKAAALALANYQIIQKIDRKVKEADAFQIVLEIDQINHDDLKNISTPLHVKELDSYPISLDKNEILAWKSLFIKC